MKSLILLFILFNSLNFAQPGFKRVTNKHKAPGVKLDNIPSKAAEVYSHLQEPTFNKIQGWHDIILTKIINKQTGRKEIYSFINQ